MIDRSKFFRSSLFYSIFFILPNVFAQETLVPVPYLNYSGGLRVLNIDLESLDPKEPVISQLFQAVEDDLQAHPQYNPENHFVMGYLSMLLEKNEKAHHFFELVPTHHPMYGTTLYYDALALRKIGEETGSKHEQERLCKHAMENLKKVNELTPSYFSTFLPRENALSTFCYFEARVRGGKLDAQERQWFENTLQPSQWIPTPRRMALYFDYLDKIRKHFTKEEIIAYLEFGFSIFPANPQLTEEAQKMGMTIPPSPVDERAAIEKTEGEAQAIFIEAKNLLADKQTKQALERWLDVITLYPGSYTGEYAKEEITALIRNEVKWNRPTTSFNNDLKKLPPEMLFDIAKFLWNQDYNITAYSLYEHLVEKYPYFDKTSEAVYSIARMHEDWSEWSKAIQNYSDLIEKYSKSKFFERSHFKIGFLHYMDGKYQKALEWLAKEKNLVTDPHQKAQACYWMGRTYEKMKKKKDADAQFEEIRKKYPLTYYSFILGIDPTIIKPVTSQIEPLRVEENHPLYLPSIYLGVGLHRPARQMIQEYRNENEEHLYQIVRLFHNTGFHMFSMPNAQFLSERKMEKTGLEQELVGMIFPVKYLDLVEKESASRQTDPLIVLSLIKQESGYFERAVSNANAVGLMQLLVPTAQILAKRTNDRSPNKDDLFDPQKNIRLGTEYLAQLNQQFSSDITLVLSAYNAGPERAVKWKNRWPNVRKDEFVELIPFPETRKYVKLILRNYSYYKFLVRNQNPNIQDFGF